MSLILIMPTRKSSPVLLLFYFALLVMSSLGHNSLSSSGLDKEEVLANDTAAADMNRNKDKVKTPTNILLLLTDDQDVMLGTFDYMPHVKHLLQEQGTTFANAFVHTPVCCPSRSSILTGRYLHAGKLAHNNSIAGNCYGKAWRTDTEPHHTFAVHAQNHGYTTAFMGKYLNQYHYNKTADGDRTVPPGWDYWMGLEYNSRYYNYTIVEQYPGMEHPNRLHHGDTYPDNYLPLVLRQYTQQLLGDTRSNSTGETRSSWTMPPPPLPEPWLLVVSWPTPHGPFTPEPWAKDTRRDLQAPRTPNYNTSTEVQVQKHWLVRQLQPLSRTTSERMDEYYHNRIEALLTIDEHVAEIVSQLDQRDALDHTLILYTSDNGFQFGQQRLSIDKRHLYENDIRVPFVIRGPGIVKNVTSRKIVANVDIAPTILEVVRESSSPPLLLKSSQKDVDSESVIHRIRRLEEAIDEMSGLSFWKYVSRGRETNDENNVTDPFSKRTDLLISYHGEGFEPCGLAECPAPFDDLWWMPDAWNNTYHCVRTIVAEGDLWEVGHSNRNTHNNSDIITEDSIYCLFDDDEHFVEYYDLKYNPHQLHNDYASLEPWQVQRYEKRLQELLLSS